MSIRGIPDSPDFAAFGYGLNKSGDGSIQTDIHYVRFGPTHLDVIVPDPIGLNQKDAMAAVQAVGLRLKADGVGVVVVQHPTAGTPVPTGSTVTVHLSNN